MQFELAGLATLLFVLFWMVEVRLNRLRERIKRLEAAARPECSFSGTETASSAVITGVTFPSWIASFNDFLSMRPIEQLAKSLSQCQRPLQVSRANSNERGRNYSARSAKRKPLSGSSASSRKRSSGA